MTPHSGSLCDPPSEDTEENRDRDRYLKTETETDDKNRETERQRAQTKQIKKEMWFDYSHFHIRYNGVKT